jgi:hypothetical protein
MAEDASAEHGAGTRMGGDRTYARPQRVFVGRLPVLAALAAALAAAREGRPQVLLIQGEAVLAENIVLTGQAVRWYSWMTPPARSCRRTRIALRSVTSAGSGLSGAALDRAM